MSMSNVEIVIKLESNILPYLDCADNLSVHDKNVNVKWINFGIFRNFGQESI